MGHYGLIHTWSEGCEVAWQEMSVNMEETEYRGILEHMRQSAEVHGPTCLLKISQWNVQHKDHLHSLYTDRPVQD